jgi:hypothetical protein
MPGPRQCVELLIRLNWVARPTLPRSQASTDSRVGHDVASLRSDASLTRGTNLLVPEIARPRIFVARCPSPTKAGSAGSWVEDAVGGTRHPARPPVQDVCVDPSRALARSGYPYPLPGDGSRRSGGRCAGWPAWPAAPGGRPRPRCAAPRSRGHDAGDAGPWRDRRRTGSPERPTATAIPARRWDTCGRAPTAVRPSPRPAPGRHHAGASPFARAG